MAATGGHAGGAQRRDHRGDDGDPDTDDQARPRRCGVSSTVDVSVSFEPDLASSWSRADLRARCRRGSPSEATPPCRRGKGLDHHRPDHLTHRSRPSPAAARARGVRCATRMVKVLKMMNAPTTTPMAGEAEERIGEEPEELVARASPPRWVAWGGGQDVVALGPSAASIRSLQDAGGHVRLTLHVDRVDRGSRRRTRAARSPGRRPRTSPRRSRSGRRIRRGRRSRTASRPR